MYVHWDLGFSSLVLVVVFLVFPVIGLVLQRKWRLDVARTGEIQRLLILASKEAARAELEDSLSYGTVSVPGNIYQCAVCFSPTTTRCARCKAVRYCSGKCQIIHWRQGHKKECHPPTYHNDDGGSSSGQKVSQQEQHDVYDDKYNNATIETSSLVPGLSSSCYSPKVSRVKDEDVIANTVIDNEGTYSISESSSTSFSGFSPSSASGESGDDASVSGSISSNEPEGLDGQMSPDIPFNMLESSLNKVDQTKPLSPKFASLVDKPGKLNQSRPHGNEGEIQCRYTSSSVQSISLIYEDSTTEAVKVISGFQGRTLESVESSSGAQYDSDLHHSGRAGNSKLFDSESLLHFKLNLFGSNVPSFHEQRSDLKGTVSGDALPTTMGNNKPVDRSSLSVNSDVDSPNNTSSPFENCGRSNYKHNCSGDLYVLKSDELRPASSSSYQTHLPSSNGDSVLYTDTSKDCRPPSSSSKRSNLVVNDHVSASHLSKSSLSSSTSQTHLVSNANVHSPSSAKFEKAENIGTGAVTSSQTASISPSSISGLKSSVWKYVDQLRGPKCGRYIDKGFFSYDVFVKLYTSNKVDLQPCGLVNCGNSCYANAVLQCLAFTPPLTAYFFEGLHSKACVNKEWCFSCEFENLILKAKEGKSPLSPNGILSQLQSIGSQLGSGREEDAHEFLRHAIDTMQSICLKEAGGNALGYFEETTLIGLTFGGYLRSKIKCMKCQYKSEQQERMMDLTVEIEGDIGKLEDALKRFTGTEILDGENKYQCSRCKSYEKAKKRLTILEAPNILTIALKRFQSGKFGKLNKSIRFPEILDLAPYMSGTSDKSPIYRLYGVVVHLDVMNASFSGHYVSYVKNIQNKWFKIDDSTVTAVELEKVLTKGAYMLLYARCYPRAPRLIRNRKPDQKMNGIPLEINAKNNTTLNSRTTSTGSGVVQIPPDSLASVESFYLKFHRLQRILGDDSSSDNYSFTSSNSDEGSCSTDSTRDSTSTDDLTDYIFGSWNSSWRSPSDSDTCSSSSSSPLYSRHSPHAGMDRNAPVYHETSGSQTDHADLDNWDRLVDMEGKGVDPFLHYDTIKYCRKLGSSSSSRVTNSGFGEVKADGPLRRSVSQRTE